MSIFNATIDWDAFYQAKAEKERARKTADICYRCFKELPSREYAHGLPVYQIKDYGENVPVCFVCAPKVLAEEGLYIPEQVKVVPAKFRYEWQCSGAHCSRAVVFLDQKPPARKRVFCSQECRASGTRAQPQQKTCEVCGEPFTATRSDAKTCSPACRQKAYRQRMRTA